MRIRNVAKGAIEIKIERRGRGVNPTEDVPISTIVPLHNLRGFINRSVSQIRVFECQLCHVEDGDTVIGRVGRCHIGIVMPLAADHDHLVCCLGGVASVCKPGEGGARAVGPKPAKGREGEDKELVIRRC